MSEFGNYSYLLSFTILLDFANLGYNNLIPSWSKQDKASEYTNVAIFIQLFLLFFIFVICYFFIFFFDLNFGLRYLIPIFLYTTSQIIDGFLNFYFKLNNRELFSFTINSFFRILFIFIIYFSIIENGNHLFLIASYLSISFTIFKILFKLIYDDLIFSFNNNLLIDLLKVSKILWISNLSNSILIGVSRIYILKFDGPLILGIYTFISQIINTIQSFLSMYFVTNYKHYLEQNNYTEFKLFLKKTKNFILLSFILLFSFSFLYCIYYYVNNPISTSKLTYTLYTIFISSTSTISILGLDSFVKLQFENQLTSFLLFKFKISILFVIMTIFISFLFKISFFVFALLLISNIFILINLNKVSKHHNYNFNL